MIQAKNDLSSHFDTAVVSLADLNRNRSSANEQNQNEILINKQTGGATSLENQKYPETQTIGDPNMNESPKRGELFLFIYFCFSIIIQNNTTIQFICPMKNTLRLFERKLH